MHVLYCKKDKKNSKETLRKYCFVTNIKCVQEPLTMEMTVAWLGLFLLIRRVKQNYFSYIVRLNFNTSE